MTLKHGHFRFSKRSPIFELILDENYSLVHKDIFGSKAFIQLSFPKSKQHHLASFLFTKGCQPVIANCQNVPNCIFDFLVNTSIFLHLHPKFEQKLEANPKKCLLSFTLSLVCFNVFGRLFDYLRLLNNLDDCFAGFLKTFEL